MNPAYTRISDHIIARLESGVIPWRQNWKESASNGGGLLPYNISNGKKYRGINTLTLLCSNYSSAGWLTYKQAAAMGAQVRKGEKSTPVVWWSFPSKDEDRAPYMRIYHVFNSEQVDGLPAADPDPDAIPFNPIEAAESITARYMASESHPTLSHGGSSAYYSPSHDHVQMPPRESFVSSEGYYGVLFHEFIHSTGVRGRSEREECKGVKRFGDLEYSKEELTAEFGAAFLCGEAGISNADQLDNSASYIANWLTKLKSDKTFAIHAAQRAQKAADYILGVKFEADPAGNSEVAE